MNAESSARNRGGAFTDRVFRASKSYRLVPLERLPAEEQLPLAELGRDPECFGVLKPIAAGTIKAVDKDVALLLYALRQPGRLPGYARRGAAAAEGSLDVGQLVLDGILEVESDGRFLCGPRALALLAPVAPPPKSDGAIARLSRQALRYGESLRLGTVQELSARLYFYNRRPLTPQLEERFADAAIILGLLAKALDASPERLLPGWRFRPPQTDGDWLSWEHSDEQAPRLANSTTFKLYLSPVLEDLPDAFRILVEELSRSRAFFLKIGADAAGLLRPDKIVAYFQDLEELSRTAAAIGHRLTGIAPHGVPFTAEIAGHGLLSWGMDPPRDEQILSWLSRESWRLWVTNRLAGALIAARHEANDSLPGWRFAVERIRLQGIDTDRWIPPETLWQQPEMEG